MSFWATAIVAANSAVATPTIAISVGTQSLDGGEHRVDAHHQEHAGGDHRRRVDERRHRRRALHRVGQPHVQRQLRALAAGADEQHQRDRGGGRLAESTALGGVR